MVIPLCPFEREYSGNTSCQPPSSGPTFKPTTYLPTYLHIYISNVRNTTHILGGTHKSLGSVVPSHCKDFFWHLSPKNFPVKCHTSLQREKRGIQESHRIEKFSCLSDQHPLDITKTYACLQRHEIFRSHLETFMA